MKTYRWVLLFAFAGLGIDLLVSRVLHAEMHPLVVLLATALSWPLTVLVSLERSHRIQFQWARFPFTYFLATALTIVVVSVCSVFLGYYLGFILFSVLSLFLWLSVSLQWGWLKKHGLIFRKKSFDFFLLLLAMGAAIFACLGLWANIWVPGTIAYSVFGLLFFVVSTPLQLEAVST